MQDKYYVVEAIFKDGTNRFSASFTDKVKCQILGNEYKKAYRKTPNKIVKVIIHELDTYEEVKQLRGQE
jgi:hypothetical protein